MNRCTELIKRANDKFRSSLQGGQVVITAGVAALGALAQNEIIHRVERFTVFDKGEHSDSFDYAGHKIFWKIDAYDLPRQSLPVRQPHSSHSCRLF